MTWDWTAETLEGLQQFLETRGITAGALTAAPIGDGHSNLTYLVSDGTSRVVVRRPPPPPTPPGAHDMLREARLIGALGDTGIPVAELLATAEAGEVLDVPLYVMSFVEGPVITTETPAPLDTPETRGQIGKAMVDTLVALHDVDWVANGLNDLGRPEGFNRRHLQRMARLIADHAGNPPAHFAAIDSWLQERVPEESGATVVHNDFRIGNVIVAAGPPGSVLAVLDWELATIGDPLIDVAYFLASVPDPDAPLTPTQELATAMLGHGYPSRKELSDRYAERSGRDLTGLPWYTALVHWKLAVLYEYGRRRAIRGVGDPYYADPAKVQSFLEAAHAAAGLEPPPYLNVDPEEEA
jgi:aminoglycoside phosphotransferase (APT) family kinase protein